MGLTTPRERLRDVRRWRRATVQGASLAQRADRVYTVLIVVAIFGGLLYGTAQSALAQVLTAAGVATWGPAVLLVGLTVAARWGAYQGPVVYPVADIGHLLGAPLSRRALATRPLARSLAAGAVTGALLGGLAVVGLAGRGRGIGGAREAGFVVALALLSVVAVAAASAVQSSARVERALGRLAWLALVVAAVAGVVGRRDPGIARLERWSGPWGWATAPVTAAAWPLAVALLALAAVLAVAGAVLWCGRCPTERHVRRAEARAGAAASLAAFDARSMRRALDDVGARGPRRGRRTLLRPPRRPKLLLAWRGATALQRTPARAAEAVVLGAAGGALLLAAADRPTAALLGGLLLYVAATRLLEPLRQEVDAPARTQVLLRARWGQVLLEHTFLPAALIGVTVLAGVAVAAATQTVLPNGAALALIAVLGAPAATLAAALSARRGGRLPSSVLSVASGIDGVGGFVVVGWLVTWPLVGALAAAGPVALAAGAGGAATLWAVALGAAAVLVLSTILRSSERP